MRYSSLSLGMIAVMIMTPISSLYAVTGDAAMVTNDAASANNGAATVNTTDTLSAAPTVAPSAGSALGEYKTVSCSSNSSFTVNSCDQCFDGGSVKVGSRITGLFDTWTNPTANILISYKDEQKTPNMAKFGNSTWTTTPASEAGVFKYSSDVMWTPAGSGSRSSFTLSPSTKVKFIEADVGAGYTLEKTDRKNGEIVGILKFPVVSHSVSLQDAKEGAATTHNECVAYKLDAPVAVVAPVIPAKVAPVKEMTQTETGPETLLLIAAAFFIAFGLMFTLRRRV